MDATSLYWVDATLSTAQRDKFRIARMSKGGGTVDQVVVASEYPADVTLDEDHVYWISGDDSGQLSRAPKTGGTAHVLAKSLTYPEILTLAGGVLYMSIEQPPDYSNSILSLGTSGGSSPAPLVIDQTVSALVTDGTYVYWPDMWAKSIFRVPAGVAGAHRQRIASGEYLELTSNLVTDGDYVYWGEGTVGGTGGSVKRVKKDGSAPVETVATSASPDWIAVDADYVYWTDQGNTDAADFVYLYRAPKAGGDATPLVKADWMTHTFEYVLVDGDAVFYDDYQVADDDSVTETLFRLAK
jgi:sugar lactone lactonase YvrE